jgi:hypothetical protein
MARSSWYGYHPGDLAALRQKRQTAFEAELNALQQEEIALRQRLRHLETAEERLTAAIAGAERTEEALRIALTDAIDRESAQLAAAQERYAQAEAEQIATIAALQQERERVARIEAALLLAVRSALAQHGLQEEEQP